MCPVLRRIGTLVLVPLGLAVAPVVSRTARALDHTTIIAPAQGTFACKDDSSGGLLPFNLPTPDVLRAARKKVFAHFTCLGKNIGRTGATSVETDYYSIGFLDMNGENDKHKATGGWLRDRPLSLPYDATLSADELARRAAEADVSDGLHAGLDGFIVNFIGSSTNEQWWRGTYSKFWEAAHRTAPGFQFMLMPDCTLGFKDPKDFLELVQRFRDDPSVFRRDGKIVLAPYAGDNYTPAQWKDILARLSANGTPVFLVPCVQGFARLAREYAGTAPGLAEWSEICGNVASATSTAARNAARLVHGAGYTVWMQPVRPQDFRPHIGSVSEAGNTRLFRESWMRAIESGADWVQIVTWSDHAESSAIRPTMGAQYLFADLCAYFSNWYKAGKPPAVVRDALFYCYRQHSSQAAVNATLQTKGLPIEFHGGKPSDEIEMLAFLTAPALLGITIEGQRHTTGVPAGVFSFTVPLTAGRPEFTITRNGKTLIRTRGRFTVSDQIIFSDFMYFGGSSLREHNYAAEAPVELSGAVLELSFNEVWGPICYDSSGYGHHATAYRTDAADEVTTVPHAYGKDGNAVFFCPANIPGGHQKHLRIPLTAALSAKTLSLAAWIRPAPGTTGAIVEAGNEKDSIFTLGLTAPDTLTFTTATSHVSCPIAMDANKWTHIAVTADGRNAQLYVDGLKQSTAPCTPLSWKTRGDLRIARGYAGGLDELLMFERAITNEEIAALVAGHALLAYPKHFPVHPQRPGTVR